MAFGTRPTCGAAAHPVQVGTVNNAKVTVQAFGTTMRPTRTSMPNKRGENAICTGDASRGAAVFGSFGNGWLFEASAAAW